MTEQTEPLILDNTSRRPKRCPTQLADRLSAWLGFEVIDVIGGDNLVGVEIVRRAPDGSIVRSFVRDDAALAVAALLDLRELLDTPLPSRRTRERLLVRALSELNRRCD